MGYAFIKWGSEFCVEVKASVFPPHNILKQTASH